MATDRITQRLATACGLLSQQSAAAPRPASSGAGPINAQKLTIFYGGMVVVLDGCTPDKAAELIGIAAAAAAAGQQAAPPPQPGPAPVDTPIVTRNLSLRRFLSKRKERATAQPARENVDEPERPAAKKGRLEASREEAASWLALGSLATMHAR